MKTLSFDPAVARTLRIEPPMSDAQLEAFCQENDVARIERTREGVISMNPPAGFPSSSGNAEVVAQLKFWWRTHRRGAVGDSSAGYYLPDGSMMSPDASYLAAETFAKVNPKLRGFRTSARTLLSSSCPRATACRKPSARWNFGLRMGLRWAG